MKILSLETKNVRGVKDIKIEPKGENVVIFGPNGTGKSAIVDAVDFLFTGKISRLGGEGSKVLFLKDHGCHIDSRDNLKNTIVIANVEIEGNEILIERSINKPNNLKVSPEKYEDLVLSHLEVAKLGQHILTRRDILKYITAESGKRAKEIQSLMDLKNIENLRQKFVSINTEADSEFIDAKSNLSVAKSDVSNLISLEDFSVEEVLSNVNGLRGILKGPKITELSPEKIKRGLKPYPFEGAKEVLTKVEIKSTLKETKKILRYKDTILKRESELKNLLGEIVKEAKFKQLLLYKKLFEAGISLVDDSNICPLCGREWEKGDFKAYLEEKIEESEIVREKQEKINEISSQIKGQIDLLKKDIINLEKAHGQFKLKVIDRKELERHISLLDAWSVTMLKPLETFEKDEWPTVHLETAFDNAFLSKKIFIPLEASLIKQGEQFSKQQIAWDTLTKMEDRWRAYQKALERKNVSELFKKRAFVLLDSFEKSRDTVMEEIYSAVEDNLDEYYKAIHSEDEAGFVSKISPKGAELVFEVDFYGRGMFPPHALHSEGHQDSLGVCLFFALNRYLTEDLIKVIVMDDVVMSIDRSHRRGICHLLKEFFADKQFIITTHAKTWANQLKTEGIVSQKNLIHFINWDVDIGPTFELDEDLWEKIQEDLNRDDVPSAAQKLRRNAECFFENMSHRLKVTGLQYNSAHDWTLGDFAPAVISAYKKYLKRARKNSKKAGPVEKVKELEDLEKKSKEIIVKSQVEQWIINKNVHYSTWGEFSREDFEPVVLVFKNLFDLFICDSCDTTITKGETADKIISCSCGEVFWNISN